MLRGRITAVLFEGLPGDLLGWNRAKSLEAGAVEGLVDTLMKRDAGVDEPLGNALPVSRGPGGRCWSCRSGSCYCE